MRDFCRLHEDGSPAALARCKPLPRDDQAGAEPQRPRFTLETLDDLAQLPPTTWLVHERIPADSLTLLYGASESGKSFIALHWALTIALRNPERAVVYVAPEGGSGYQRRAAAWLEHWKKPVPKNLLFIRSAPRLGDTADLNELINAIVPYQPIFTVLDTLARCAVELDENSAKDMGIFIEACDKIRRATGSAVMPVHHSGKDARSGARGSSALRAAVDMAHEVVRDDELVTLSCDKSKDIAKPDPIYLHMVDVAESVVLLPSDKVISTSSKLTARERAVLAALNLEVFQTSGAKSRQIFEVAQVPEGTAYGILSKLKRLGLLSQDAKGDPYRITEAGKKQLSDYERTVNSGASWAPDDDDDPDDDPPTGGDNGGHSSHSSGHSDPAPTMNEYGSVMPNYGTMKGFSEEKPIVDPEMPENGDSNYESDTASQCPTMTTMKHYEATMNSDDPSLLWEGGYIYDSPHSESEREEQAGESPVTDDNQEPPPEPSASGAAAPPDAAQGAAPAADGAAPDPAPAEPAHDAALIAACGPMADDTRAKIAQARQTWRGSEKAHAQLCRVLGWDVADAIRAWVEAEKLARAAQARGEQQREVRHE
jgi:predicted transcriptional regulator